MATGTRSRWRRAAVVVPILIGLLALGLRIWQPGPLAVTTDEPFWLIRADGFRTALVHGDLAGATAAGKVTELDNATMPGVTTMWAVNAGRGLVQLGATLGIGDQVVGPSVQSASVVRAGRGVLAAWSALLIAVIVALGRAVVGRVAGTVAGVLLATEPWFVGLGNVVHTDELVALLGAVSMTSLVWVLRRVRRGAESAGTSTPSVPPRWMLAASGACAGMAVSTKLNALALVVPGAVLIVLIESVPGVHFAHRWKPIFATRLFRRWARLALWWSAGALVAFVALWPALWVDPVGQWHDLVRSAGLAGDGHPQFFLGSVTDSPAIIYYPVAWAFRMTPWMLIGALAVAIACVVQFARWVRRGRHRPREGRNPTGPIPLWLALVGVPYAVIISLAPTKFDRYVTPLLPFLALAVGVVVAGAAEALARRSPFGSATRRVGMVAGVGATAVISVLTLVQAPYAISYTNRMLGGQGVARHVILLGWGEGRAAMGAAVADREAGNCALTRVVMIGVDSTLLVPCGHPVRMQDWLRDPHRGDYVVTTIDLAQRLGPELPLPEPGWKATLVDQLEIGGVPYAQLWQVN